MSKSPTPTSTLFPQVSRGESNDAAKGLLDDAGDSSGDEAHYAPRGDYAPPRPVTSPPVTTQPSGELNQCAIVGGEEVSFVEISPDRPRLRASASSGDAPPRRPIASHGPTTYEAYLATRRAPSKDDLEPPTCRESCCPCLPKARPPPEEKDGATPLKRPSKSLDDEDGENEKKEP
jgi:hypothetical protein